MHIVFCAEPGYFQHVAVAMASLLDRHVGVALHVHLLRCVSDPRAEARLAKVFTDHPRASLTTHVVPADLLAGLFVDKYLSRETYMRLLVADVLPATIRRVLYLDSDLVVLDDLRPLLGIDLGGRVIGAAPDYPMVPHVVAPRRLADLGMPPDSAYVNAGVLLLDLDVWRREDLTRRIMAFVAERGTQLEFHDQDAINAVLHDQILLLDCRWNLQARMFRCGRNAYPVEFEATRLARRSPGILHYVGAEKPWKFRTRTARKGDYVRYLDRTEWRAARPALASPLERAEWRIDRALARVGIDYLQVLWRLGRLPRVVRQGVGAAFGGAGHPTAGLR